MQITEGYLPFLEYQTYYRIVGAASSTKAPLILLHGGPGSTHTYFESLDAVAMSGRQLIMYDQLGCGRSFVSDRPDLWHSQTWVAELIALIKHLGLTKFHLLGQSWGGMLALEYVCDHQPEGLQSLILSSTLPASQLWAQEQARLIKLLSPADQEAIAQAIHTNDFTQEAYLRANERFMLRHGAGPVTAASPEYLRRAKKVGREAYETAWGPNEFYPNGTLQDWDYREKLPEISVPSLVISGVDDLSTPLVAKTMTDLIPNAQWHLYPHSRHMPFVDEGPAYIRQLIAWLEQHD